MILSIFCSPARPPALRNFACPKQGLLLPCPKQTKPPLSRPALPHTKMRIFICQAGNANVRLSVMNKQRQARARVPVRVRVRRGATQAFLACADGCAVGPSGLCVDWRWSLVRATARLALMVVHLPSSSSCDSSISPARLRRPTRRTRHTSAAVHFSGSLDEGHGTGMDGSGQEMLAWVHCNEIADRYAERFWWGP